MAPQRRWSQGGGMLAGLPIAIALLEAAGAAQSTAAAPQSPPKATERCSDRLPTGNDREIVVCVQRHQGYRLNPDVVEAKRALRSGRPKRPERINDTSCASVGPMGCTPGAGVNLIGAALTAAQMAARLAQGKEIGSMFVTDPQPTEYQLYVEAKRAREAREAEAEAAKANPAAKAAPKAAE